MLATPYCDAHHSDMPARRLHLLSQNVQQLQTLCSRWLFHSKVTLELPRFSRRPPSAVPTPDRIALLVAQHKGVGALHHFAGEDQVGVALLNF
jgi:hypothetical protein